MNKGFTNQDQDNLSESIFTLVDNISRTKYYSTKVYIIALWKKLSPGGTNFPIPAQMTQYFYISIDTLREVPPPSQVS